jgi:capsular polysaccharide transport system permease protein
MKYAEPPRVEEIELQPVHAKGELVVDNWWQPDHAPEVVPFHRKYRLELLTLALPIAFGVLYQVVIAAPRYISESEFMVRTLGSSDMGNIATLLTDQKVTRASDETYAVSAYMTSRDAVDALVRNDRLRDALASPQADFINRFPNFYTRDTRERLYWHFQDFVDLSVSSESGIAKLDAVAFTPQDALALNKGMLRNAENFVNKLNTRIFADSLNLAAAEVEALKTKFTEIEARLTAYRNTQSVLDPNKEVADTLTRIGALMTKLSQAESEMAQTTSLTPRSPQLASLASQATALRDQIATERARMAGDRGSLAGKFAEFDRIVLDRTLASKQLEAALAQYDKSRADATRQHFYLQTVVDPEAPDMATRPRRLINIAAIAALSLCFYSIARAILKNIREHAT